MSNNVMTLKSASRSLIRSLEVVPFDRLILVIYEPFLIFDFKNAVTLKTGLGVCEGHRKCYHSIESLYDFLLILFNSLVTMAVPRVVSEVFNVEKYRDLEIPVRSVKVIQSGTIR